MNSFRIPLSLLACTAAVLAFPAAGSAKLKVGVQGERLSSQTLSRAEVLRMRAGGVKLVRTPFEWDVVQTAGPNAPYDFTNYDQLVKWATEGALPKLRILPILIGSPSWVKRAASNNEPPVTQFDLTKWRQFVTAAAARYKPSGAIKEWQVWNEPNLKIFWTKGKPDPREYAAFLKLTGKAIDRGDSSAKTILAGMPERSNGPLPMRKYLKKLYKVKRFTKLFDAVAVHPFAENHKGVLGGVSRIRDIMDDEGDKKKPLWVTEVGYASSGPKSPFTSSPKGQAKLLTKTFKALRKASKKLGVQRAVWYTWRDSDTDPPAFKSNDRWQTFAGLFTFNGAPKFSWNAFTKFAGGNRGSGSLPGIMAKPLSAKPLSK